MSTFNQPKALSSVQLPPIDTVSFVSGRHEVNPAIALNLIQDIQLSITNWQLQQREVISAMRTLHAQGPMVDGWLQSSRPSQPSRPIQTGHTNLLDDTTILRHGDANALMRYVESLEVESLESDNIPNEAQTVTQTGTADLDSGASQYWLCYLNDDGSICSQLCPAEQMVAVGTAIARFQKFKQLKLKQQALEIKLQQAVDMLTGIRTAICN
ncbi:MAG: hypothetical protein AAF703_08035 [Cyanobacteria bacterium P01_D01_bin.105]